MKQYRDFKGGEAGSVESFISDCGISIIKRDRTPTATQKIKITTRGRKQHGQDYQHAHAFGDVEGALSTVSEADTLHAESLLAMKAIWTRPRLADCKNDSEKDDYYARAVQTCWRGVVARARMVALMKSRDMYTELLGEPQNGEISFAQVVTVALVKRKLVKAAQTAKKTVYLRNVAPKPKDQERKSLHLFSLSNPVRQAAIQLTDNGLFNHFIVACILLNAVMLALTDYTRFDTSTGELRNEGWRNQLNTQFEPFFTAIFTIECVTKIVALGFISHRNAYLRSGWNILDFVVVVAALIEAAGVKSEGASVLRVFRVMRPLRTVQHSPGLRMVVSALINTLSRLGAVLVLAMFCFVIFAIMGVQLWGVAGNQHLRCRLTPHPVRWNTSHPGYAQMSGNYRMDALPIDHVGLAAQWLLDPTLLLPCTNLVNGQPPDPSLHEEWGCYWPIDLTTTELCGNKMCPAAFHSQRRALLSEAGGTARGTEGAPLAAYANTSYCGSNYYPNGYPRFMGPAGEVVEKILATDVYVEDLAYGYTTFDTTGGALIAVFQAATLEGWTDIMYQVIDSWSEPGGTLYFVLLLTFGSFFVLNLIVTTMLNELGNLRNTADHEIISDKLGHLFTRLAGTQGLLTLAEVETARLFGEVDPDISLRLFCEMDKDKSGYIEKEEFVSVLTVQVVYNGAEVKGLMEEDCSFVAHGARFDQHESHVAENKGHGKGIKGIVTACRTLLRKTRHCEYPWMGYRFAPLTRVVVHPAFETLVMVVVFANLIVMMQDKYPQTDSEARSLDIGNFVCLATFTLELLLKIPALGVRDYFQNHWNMTDFVIVFISLVETAIAPPSFLGHSGGGDDYNGLSALRTLRVFRVVKLVRFVPSLRILVSTIVAMVQHILPFVLLTMIMIYIFTLMGMQIFANKLHFDPATGYVVKYDDPMFDSAECDIDDGWDTFGSAALRTFVILTGDDWADEMYKARRSTGGVGVAYFVAWTVFGNLILLNLFVAVMTESFEKEYLFNRALLEEEVRTNGGVRGSDS
jgi:hypothetical protein